MIRWKVMRDLTDASDEAVAAERTKVATEGWCARLLALHGPDGQGPGGIYLPVRANGDGHPVDARTRPWHYDVLRGLDYLRAAGVPPDERAAEAVDLVRQRRDADGRWLLDGRHEGELHFEMDEGIGKPSRWNTLRALRVLRWYEAA